jgi:hypothetical protein
MRLALAVSFAAMRDIGTGRCFRHPLLPPFGALGYFYAQFFFRAAG